MGDIRDTFWKHGPWTRQLVTMLATWYGITNNCADDKHRCVTEGLAMWKNQYNRMMSAEGARDLIPTEDCAALLLVAKLAKDEPYTGMVRVAIFLGALPGVSSIEDLHAVNAALEHGSRQTGNEEAVS